MLKRHFKEGERIKFYTSLNQEEDVLLYVSAIKAMEWNLDCDVTNGMFLRTLMKHYLKSVNEAPNGDLS